MTYEKSFFEKLFILFCLIITCILVYYHSKQPKVEGWNIYISGAARTTWQTNWIKTGEKTAWNTDLNVGKNNNSVKQWTAWTSSQWDSKTIQFEQRVSNSTRVLVKWFPEDSFANNVATYAYRISSWDMDFLMTLKAENWAFDMYKQSNVVKNWKREDSWWLCQLHRAWYRDIVDNPLFWSDWKRQVEQCWDKYKWWTKFYGYFVREKYKNDFTIK